VLGYAALPEHDVDSGLEALGELLASSLAATTGGEPAMQHTSSSSEMRHGDANHAGPGQ
jgi:hypothetical protein